MKAYCTTRYPCPTLSVTFTTTSQPFQMSSKAHLRDIPTWLDSESKVNQGRWRRRMILDLMFYSFCITILQIRPALESSDSPPMKLRKKGTEVVQVDAS
ncbi:hypothetical protein L210DRAFT_949249 [Boletus edulis BED1]|uniref:Uncharacterized protein n=1 Tax=Boletus edulis BED1 TaxID=1328754 RepID=A0AAD4GH22_BOLED|nr:hypothetical protein L210DRAFT_949249 [Boletus edulis BED1]